jgi:aminopeptidase N
VNISRSNSTKVKRIAASLTAGTIALLSSCTASDDASSTTSPAVSSPAWTTNSSTTPPITAAPSPPVAGADGVGDTLFPTAGNSGYDVADYNLSINWDPASKHLDGHETITATPTENLSSFGLDLFGLDVASVDINGAAATVNRDGSKLRITPSAPLPEGKVFTTDISYAGTPAGGDGQIGWLTLENYVAVMGEPGSPNWFAVNGHPRDKATYTIRLTVPEGTTAAANGELTQQTTIDGRTTSTFRMSQPMASYLATVIIGPFSIVEGRTTSSSVKVRHYVATSLLAEGTQLFAPTSDMIETFEKMFGPFPFVTYGGVLITDKLGFALETQSLPVFAGNFASGDNSWSVAHELAHQWFGDDVTLETWRDTWLNEAFATYAELLWAQSQDPKIDIAAWISHTVEMGGPGMNHPPASPATGADILEPAVYQRGALALHALRTAVGDDTFFKILQTWVQRFGGANATAEDFIALSEELSGQDLTDLFQTWLYADHLPPSLDGVDLVVPAPK